MLMKEILNKFLKIPLKYKHWINWKINIQLIQGVFYFTLVAQKLLYAVHSSYVYAVLNGFSLNVF